MDILFSGPSHVDIQGDRVLRFGYINQKFAQYSLIGFESKNLVHVFDYRDNGLKAMNSLLETSILEEFAPKFNNPAHATLSKTNKGEIRIELQNTNVMNPSYMLWIAIGIDKNVIPEYDFILREMLPYKEKVALLSLYKRPYPDELPLYYSPVNL